MMRLICAIVVVAGLWAALPASGKEYLFVHNTNSGEISKISIPEHELAGEIEIGLYMDYLAKSPDNTVLYVNRIHGDLPGSPVGNVGVDGEIIAVDTRTDEILWRMDVDGMPHHMSVSKDGRLMFVPYYDTWWVAVIDLEKRAIIKKIFVGHGSHGTKVSDDGKRLYVGSMMYDTLTVIGIESLMPLNRFGFADGVRPFAFPKDESVIYVQLSRLHGFVVLDPRTREQRVVRMPDLGQEAPKPAFYPHTVNHGLALNPGETELWANGSTLNFVAVYSHPELELIATIPVGEDPNSISFNGDGRFAYVTNRGENTLSIIDAREHREIKRMPLGELPQRMVVIDVPE